MITTKVFINHGLQEYVLSPDTTQEDCCTDSTNNSIACITTALVTSSQFDTLKIFLAVKRKQVFTGSLGSGSLESFNMMDSGCYYMQGVDSTASSCRIGYPVVIAAIVVASQR